MIIDIISNVDILLLIVCSTVMQLTNSIGALNIILKKELIKPFICSISWLVLVINEALVNFFFSSVFKDNTFSNKLFLKLVDE